MKIMEGFIMNMETNDWLSRLENRQPLEFSFFNNNEPTSEKIRDILENVMKMYGKDNLAGPVRFYTNTLVHHAEKENVKNAFFRNNNIDPNDMGHYIKGLSSFREIDGKQEYFDYFYRLKDMDLWIKLKLNHSKDGICLEVENNTPLPDIEEMWLRIKLKKSMLFNHLIESGDVKDYNLDFGNPGIGLIAILMKKENMDARLFRIGSRKDTAFSRIEIPFTEEYTPVRRYIKADA